MSEKGWPEVPKRRKKHGRPRQHRGYISLRGGLPGAAGERRLCKRSAGNLTGKCRETARGLAGNLREMCEGIAGNLRKDPNRSARALQEICRGRGTCRESAGTLQVYRGPAGQLQGNREGACRESARNRQGLRKRIAGNLQGNCREIACRGTAETLPDGCQTIKLSVCCQS